MKSVLDLFEAAAEPIFLPNHDRVRADDMEV